VTAHAFWGLELTAATRWAGADPADAYSADLGWWARQLRPGPQAPRLELRVEPDRTLLLGRVSAADRHTADRFAVTAREVALDLPGHVRARILQEGGELERAVQPPWRPAAAVGVVKHVIRERALRHPDVGYSAVQPFNAGPPASGSQTPAELLASSPAATMLSCLLVPSRMPAGLAARLQQLAAEFDELAQPKHVPPGIYGAGHTLPAEPFASTGSALFRDAAVRYHDSAFRFRAVVATAGWLDPAVVDSLANSISPYPLAPPLLPIRAEHPLRGLMPARLPSVRDDLPPPASLSAQLTELADPAEAAAIARLPVPTAPRRLGRDGPEVFVSYRTVNGDSARLLKTTLDAAFGPAAVFLDYDSVHLGQRMQQEIWRALENCRLMLVVIDRDWLDTANPDGSRRLEDPDDWVRLEVRYGLEHPVRVVPVLWNGTPLPKMAHLPQDMQGMLEWKALEVRHPSALRDLNELVNDIRLALKQGPPPPVSR
jgi:hypothetical protein